MVCLPLGVTSSWTVEVSDNGKGLNICITWPKLICDVVKIQKIVDNKSSSKVHGCHLKSVAMTQAVRDNQKQTQNTMVEKCMIPMPRKVKKHVHRCKGVGDQEGSRLLCVDLQCEGLYGGAVTSEDFLLE